MAALDPTTWSDVTLALAGAPIGALITVGGVALTNRNNAKSNRKLLKNQLKQQRQQHDFELRAEIQRETLTQRSAIYVQILELCERAVNMAAWGSGNEVPDLLGPIDNETIHDGSSKLPRLHYAVNVHCSYEVRAEYKDFREAFEAVSETSEPLAWDKLIEKARYLEQAVISAAVVDRSGGPSPAGLGGK